MLLLVPIWLKMDGMELTGWLAGWLAGPSVVKEDI
jgi:hypothetical protein